MKLKPKQANLEPENIQHGGEKAPFNCKTNAGFAAPDFDPPPNGVDDFYSEMDLKNQILEAERDTILANESQVLFTLETTKVDNGTLSHAEFKLGSNSSTMGISTGQWV